MWPNFQEGKRLAKAGRLTLTKAKVYIELIKQKDKLFDMHSEDPGRRKALEEEWGVKMGERERLYLEDQRGPSTFPAQYPVKQQATNIDDTPTNNMDMERLMGLTKLQTLGAASRSIILQGPEGVQGEGQLQEL